MIDVRAAIKKAGLNFREVAGHLFPDNVHPYNALNRVSNGDGFLNEPQIRKLAELTGLTAAELMGESEWKGTRKGDTILFKSGDFKAELCTKDWVTKLFHNGSLFHEEIIHSGFIPLSQYVSKLNELITNHLNK
jgi:hypothetical protein